MATNDLNGQNILRKVYDPPTEALKVTGVSFNFPPGIDVDIDHTSDSVRIGDGTSLITATTTGGKVGLDVSIIGQPISVELPNDSIGQVPNIQNVAMPLANTEYSFAIPVNTKRITFITRKDSILQYSFAAGQSGTIYKTSYPGFEAEFSNLDTSAGHVLYFRSNKPDNTLEIVYWT